MNDDAAPADGGRCAFLVGQDAAGRWLAVETHGFGGGLFASREAALNYARSEAGRRPDAIMLAAEPLVLAVDPLSAPQATRSARG